MFRNIFWIGYISFFLLSNALANEDASLEKPVLSVAVASNFLQPAEQIAAAFSRQHNVDVHLSSASTGKLYAQILYGAPFDIFLAADEKRPELLANQRMAVPQSRFTYAIGELVLWSPLSNRFPSVQDYRLVLRNTRSYNRLAIANPKTAPYGIAAMEILEKLKLDKSLRSKLIIGESISQAYQFVDSGNVPIGLIARSQAINPTGHVWNIPAEDYTPIRQQAILLNRGRDKPEAQAFLGFLRSDEARHIIIAYGYRLEN